MNAPRPAPASTASGQASAGCSPRPMTSVAVKIDVHPITAPTERSMPPEKITSVIPTAAMPRNALSAKRFTSTRAEKNPS
jgi:hypothetical protein